MIIIILIIAGGLIGFIVYTLTVMKQYEKWILKNTKNMCKLNSKIEKIIESSRETLKK